MARELVRDLKALKREDRDPCAGELFRFARRLVRIKRYAATGKLPMRVPWGRSGAMRPPPQKNR